MELFAITCTTCRARLKVREQAAIGQILACPKCGSMVHVVPPEGWQPPSPEALAEASLTSSTIGMTIRPGTMPPVAAPRTAGAPSTAEPRPAMRTAEAAAKVPAAEGAPTVAVAVRERAPLAKPSPKSLPPAARKLAAMVGTWSAGLNRRWLILAAGPIAAVAIVWGGWLLFRSTPESVEGAVAGTARSPDESDTVQAAAPRRFDRRWLPPGASQIVSLRLADVAHDPAAALAFANSGSLQDDLVGPLTRLLQLPAENIEFITWATTDASGLAAGGWQRDAVTVVALREPPTARTELLPGCTPLDLRLCGATCQRPGAGGWPHPFALVDARTIVTGPLELLQKLGGDPGPQRLDEALALVDQAWPVVCVEDLVLTRAARPPTALSVLVDQLCGEIATRGKARYPSAAIVSASVGNRVELEAALLCQDAAHAETVREVVAEALAGLERRVASQASTDDSTFWMAQAAGALREHRVEVKENTVWLSTHLAAAPAELAHQATAAGGVERLLAALPQALMLPEPEAVAEAAADEPRSEDDAPAAAVAIDSVDPAANDEPPPDVADAPELPPAKPTISRAGIEARLADPLASFAFDRVPLAQLVDLLSQMTALPISLDLDGLSDAGVGALDPVTIRLKDTTVAGALEAILAKRGLVYAIEGQHVLVTSPQRQDQTTSPVTYEIGDLLAADPAAGERLVEYATRLVAPASWQSRGGPGSVRFADGALVVEQTPAVERQVLRMLDMLRVARGVPARSSARDPRSLESRSAQGRSMLASPVTVNFGVAAPLREILDWLEQPTRAKFLVDGGSLERSGLASSTPAKLVAEARPLADALTDLLAPLHLTYRVVDAKTLEIFSRRDLAGRMELEAYPVGDLLDHSTPGAQLVAQLRQRLGAAAWGERAGQGAIEFDAPGACLLILQTPAAQIRLSQALSEMRQTAEKQP